MARFSDGRQVNMDTYTLSDPLVVMLEKPPGEDWREVGRTEMIKDVSENPSSLLRMASHRVSSSSSPLADAQSQVCAQLQSALSL